MKRIMFILIIMLSVLLVKAQAPQAMNYQAVARDSFGNILPNQPIGIRISILSDTVNGLAVYKETFNVITNALGLFSLHLGQGSPVMGTFAAINWAAGIYFIKVEIDINGGNSYTLAGISQMLTVPYAMYANAAGFPRMTDEEREAIINPQEGMIIYNLTSGCLNIRRSDSWYQDCSFECIPQPTAPNAGMDISGCGDSIVQLSANTPVRGTGLWSVINGTGGNFSDIHDPHAQFSGHFSQDYILQWQIYNYCNTLNDEIIVHLLRLDTADAGQDQALYAFNTTLQGNTPEPGYQGNWSIINGQGGNFSDFTNPLTQFQGDLGKIYTLRWTIWSPCDTSYDDVVISFCPTHIPADAGADITITLGTSCLLQGNIPWENNTGVWTIVNGSGGSFVDQTMYNTVFNGLPLTTYTLRWTITSICDTSYDDVSVTTASLWVCGDSITYGEQLYHTVLIGTQCWMKENLNIGTMIGGYSDQTNNGIIEKYCYNNNPLKCDDYGALYQWNEAMGYNNLTNNIQGICPSGFHVPSNENWELLVNYLGGASVAGGKMKETGFAHWYSPNNGATNESGFTALGAGRLVSNGVFEDIMYYAFIWSSTGELSGDSWARNMNCIASGIYTLLDWQWYGYSVRCIKD